MSFANEARGRLTEARNVLIDRRRQTNDVKERAAIDDAITSSSTRTLDLSTRRLYWMLPRLWWTPPKHSKLWCVALGWVPLTLI